MGALDDLEFRLFGYARGAWFWLANSQSVSQRTGARWDSKQGSHPFVLVSAYSGGPSARSRPRSAHHRSDFPHEAHPSPCATTCKINQPGWIQKVRWPLKGTVLTPDTFSCTEPSEAIIARLSGAGDR
jgi:hypothetical protein